MSTIKTSPVGEAKYPWVTQPDYKFNPDGLYHTELIVPKDKAEEHINNIKDVIAKEVQKHHQNKPDDISTIKRAPLPYTENADDTVTFKFKMKASGINSKTKQPFTQKPNIVDGELNPFPEDKNIFGGSMIRVNYEPVGYNVSGTGVGCTLRLKTVQVIKHVDSSNQLSGLTPMSEEDIC